MLRFNLAILIGLSIFMTSCCYRVLDVQTQYVSHENLASFYVNTPDPLRQKPLVGERLMIRWSVPCEWTRDYPLFAEIRVRFRDHTEDRKTVIISESDGTTFYCVTGDTFVQSGGIATYKIDIISEGGEVLATWRHPLWTEFISFS